MRWLLKAAGLPLALVPSVALPLLLVAAAEDRGPGRATEEAYRALPELPSAAPADTVEDLESAAVELAAKLRAVPLAESGEATCPADRLAVSWSEPGEGYDWGAHLDPVGPAPTQATKTVNGVVICQGAAYAFMGFEAWRDGGDWELAAVPYVHEEHEEHAAPVPPAPPATPKPPKPVVPAPALPAPLSLDLPTGAIEGYAAYEPQRLCDPTPKPGTLALRNLLLGNNPGTRNLGISRSCGAGGQSEHKEGRALDWGVLVSRANEKAAAERFIGQLMATDEQGHRHAMARRMGVMYVIWNRQIWSAYRASAGWRPYGGASPHTDHVHISLSWAGAQGRTSFWSGKVDPSTLLAFQPPAPSGGAGAPRPAAPVSHTRPRRTLPEGTLPTEAVEKAVRDGHRRGKDGRKRWEEREEARVAHRRRWEDLSAEEQAAVIAEREAARARRAEAEQQWRNERRRRWAEQHDGERHGHDERREDRDWDDQRAERHALREAERAKRRAEEQRRHAEEAARQAAEAAQQPAAAPAPEAPRGGRDGGRGGGHHGGHRGDGAAIREAHRQAEAQRHAERQQQREAHRQAEAQRQAERQQQRQAQKQAERQRRAEVEQQRGRQRKAEAGQRRRRDSGGGGQAAAQGGQAGQGGGGHRGGQGHGGGRGHGGGKGRGGRG